MSNYVFSVIKKVSNEFQTDQIFISKLWVAIGNTKNIPINSKWIQCTKNNLKFSKMEI